MALPKPGTGAPARGRYLKFGIAGLIVLLVILFFALAVRPNTPPPPPPPPPQAPAPPPPVDPPWFCPLYVMEPRPLKYDPKPLPAEDDCGWQFIRYEASAWEQEWTNNIETYRRDICGRLLTEADKTIPYMTANLMWSKIPGDYKRLDEKQQNDALSLFSRYVYKNTCTDKAEYRVEYIEPLIGMLRDPFSICGRLPDNVEFALIRPTHEERVQSKVFTLNGVHAPYSLFSESPTTPDNLKINGYGSDRISSAPRRILIDLGSNLFNAWGASTAAFSTDFFYRMYDRAGVPFDRIFAYEYEKLDPHKAWDVVPDSAFSVYTLINHGVESAKDSKFSPWTLLKKLAVTRADYVVIKLDIDSPDIESVLMKQLIADPDLMDVIDDMFFEHHVFIPEMYPYWVRKESTCETVTLSYDWFSKLRYHGVRMHSWP